MANNLVIFRLSRRLGDEPDVDLIDMLPVAVEKCTNCLQLQGDMCMYLFNGMRQLASKINAVGNPIESVNYCVEITVKPAFGDVHIYLHYGIGEHTMVEVSLNGRYSTEFRRYSWRFSRSMTDEKRDMPMHNRRMVAQCAIKLGKDLAPFDTISTMEHVDRFICREFLDGMM